MNILLIFATYSGSTMTASHLLQQTLQEKNHQVTMQAALETQPTAIETADLVILASPTWDAQGEEGLPHEDYQTLMQNCSGKTFPGKKFAIMALGDSNYTVFCGSADHLETWVTQLQGQKIIDSLKIDQYYMNEAENNQKIQTWAEQLSSLAA